MAVFSPEQQDKRAYTFKAYAVANLGNAHVFIGQQYFCCFHPYPGYVLVRGLFIDTGKEPVEVKARQESTLGYLFQVNGLAVMLIDKDFGRSNTLVYICCQSYCHSGSLWLQSRRNIGYESKYKKLKLFCACPFPTAKMTF